MKNESFFISCPRGLENVLQDEINNHNVEKSTVRTGGCYFMASSINAIDVLLNSRIGSKVYRRLSKFHIRDSKDILYKSQNFDWKDLFTVDQTFKISTLFDSDAKARFKNSVAISQILKDGICDYFRKECGKRPNVELKRPDIKLLLRVEKEESGFKAIILVDLCGTSLSNRGYRLRNHPAPVRENLAAGIIRLTDWKPEQELFIDTMCGSGTFLIEAAMIKNKLPPSQLQIRNFIERDHKPWDFLRHRWCNRELKEQVHALIQKYYNDIISKFNQEQSCTIYGSDLDYPSVKITMENLKNAYLPAKLVHIEKGDALSITPPKNKQGVVICNPPYGKRLTAELEELYYQYGENLKKNFGGFRAYILTGNLPLRKKISLQTSARIPLHNGDIECRLLKYDLY